MIRSYTHESINSIVEDLGARVKNLRLTQNISQDDMGEKIGISTGALKNLEKGKDVAMSTFLKCVRFLGYIENVEQVLPRDLVSPKEIILNKRQRRQRASKTINR